MAVVQITTQGEAARHLVWHPNPAQLPADEFEAAVYLGTDGLVEVGLAAVDHGVRVVRVALRSFSGAPSSDEMHQIELALSEALRNGDRPAVDDLLAWQAADTTIFSLQLAYVPTGSRATVTRYGAIELHGPANSDQEFTAGLAELIESAVSK